MPKTVDAVIFPSQFPLCLALEAETLRHVRQQLVGVAGSSLMGQTCGAKTKQQKPMNTIVCLMLHIPYLDHVKSCQIMSE